MDAGAGSFHWGYHGMRPGPSTGPVTPLSTRAAPLTAARRPSSYRCSVGIPPSPGSSKRIAGAGLTLRPPSPTPPRPKRGRLPPTVMAGLYAGGAQVKRVSGVLEWRAVSGE
ncbi:hypothetical protein NDU88_007969 [Pleurodeles waltl]|uniref:Uncharacterized protein n=1 Tax=Pleurodeles waltl TaxID=8319 RepID=A0AAV7SUA9_PLEWA|nr:hypothetical protein NDU88_007969 [Pleurodeles waltl]